MGGLCAVNTKTLLPPDVRKSVLYKVPKSHTCVKVKIPYWKMTLVKVKVTYLNVTRVKVLKCWYLLHLSTVNVNVLKYSK